MELSNSFEVAHPIDHTWAVLTDIEQIARCVPGAELREVDGREFRGVIHVKTGPITSEYAGEATVVSQSPADYKVVVHGQGLDAEGRAEATLTAHLEATSDTTTQVNLDTDLTFTGRMASLGKGVIADVGETLVAQFAENLDDLMAAGVDRSTERRPPRRMVEMPEPEAIDLMDAARTPILKRVVALVVAVVAALVLVRRIRGMRR
ncbi:MAG: hypothetical protein DHS20C19_24290 [Acidimicrobiales bacterium]|nr:MAG: hypothetical protein DHS20C19_24290 [Acidimicrobiales bacterium]